MSDWLLGRMLQVTVNLTKIRHQNWNSPSGGVNQRPAHHQACVLRKHRKTLQGYMDADFGLFAWMSLAL